MLKLKTMLAGSLIFSSLATFAAPTAQAGPLYDWLWRHEYNKLMCCAPRGLCGAPAPATCCAPQPTCCQQTCTQTCQRVVVNYVPYTAYRTDWEQVPVTQYQQTCSTDPCTGCPVTCMKPVTTCSWQMKRVPYTTYRPVYRTESYSVPVTTYSVMPSPCNTCNTCNTCAAPTYPTVAAPQTGCSTCGSGYLAPSLSTYPTSLPPSTLSTTGNYTSMPTSIQTAPYYQSPAVIQDPSVLPQNSTVTPADQVPTLGKPIIIDRREITPSSSSFQAPPLTPTNTGHQEIRPIRDPNPGLRWDNRETAPSIEDQTASAPTRRKWEYTPVRLASHTQVEPVQTSTEPRTYRGELSVEAAPARVENVNSAWKNLN